MPQQYQSSVSKVLSVVEKYRAYLDRVKEEGAMILQEFSKLVNLSVFNQKIGQDEAYKFTPNDLNFFKQQIACFEKPCERMTAKLGQI